MKSFRRAYTLVALHLLVVLIGIGPHLSDGQVPTYYCNGATNCELANCPRVLISCKDKERNEEFDPLRANCFLVFDWNATSNRMYVTHATCDFHLNCQSACKPSCHVTGRHCACCCQGDLCNLNVTQPDWKPSTPTPPPPLPTSVIVTSSTATPTTDIRVIVIAIVATVSCVVFVAVVFVLFFYWWSRSRRGDDDDENGGGGAGAIALNDKENGDIAMMSPSPYGDVDALNPSFDFGAVRKDKHIGIGRFAHVWRVACKDDDDDAFAAKIFFDFKSWNSEVDAYVMPPIKHENVLKFVAASAREKDEGEPESRLEYWLVTEYHGMGSLMDHLRNNVVTFGELCGLVKSIARGLAYLHAETTSGSADGIMKPAIAHRDMKSRNVLMKSRGVCCISDLGLAMKFQLGTSLVEAQGQVGTIRYMAPEVLEGAISFHRESFLRIDVYAMALILWEIFSRCDLGNGNVSAYQQPFQEEVGSHPGFEEMKECVVKLRMRPQFQRYPQTPYPTEAIEEMIEECWDSEGEARLTAQCVEERISQIEMYEKSFKSSGYVSINPDVVVVGETESNAMSLSEVSLPTSAVVEEGLPSIVSPPPENALEATSNLPGVIIGVDTVLAPLNALAPRHAVKSYFPPDRSSSPPPYAVEDPLPSKKGTTLVPFPLVRPKNVREDSYTETSL